MLRITTHSAADSLTFQLEGRLVGPWVTELRECWRRTPSDAKRAVHIDLRAVSYVDAAGEELLADLYRQGADLFATGCLMRAVVAEIENRFVQSRWVERNDHGAGTSRATP
jgi:ABC-type transporter Mla MlaB component